MSEPDDVDPLRDLGERLDRARHAQRGAPSESDEGEAGSSQSGLAFALSVAVELVAALAVGLAIGWAIDHWFGTRPWGLITFFFLGAAAGMLNVYRAVGGSGMMNDGDLTSRRKAPMRKPQRDKADED